MRAFRGALVKAFNRSEAARIVYESKKNSRSGPEAQQQYLAAKARHRRIMRYQYERQLRLCREESGW